MYESSRDRGVRREVQRKRQLLLEESQQEEEQQQRSSPEGGDDAFRRQQRRQRRSPGPVARGRIRKPRRHAQVHLQSRTARPTCKCSRSRASWRGDRTAAYVRIFRRQRGPPWGGERRTPGRTCSAVIQGIQRRAPTNGTRTLRSRTMGPCRSKPAPAARPMPPKDASGA
ncbi:hypothetical protein HPB50_025491 [Hyalomma asiaticum]|uniref:Uncharacterized protein n=1 Tax=Hyalomma asiaticum TaxID=266040 RepID=A0ACB7SIP5_HYAAI|nr:hypothetical protein HPB50_025491 [Hyalomma asiaticum]